MKLTFWTSDARSDCMHCIVTPSVNISDFGSPVLLVHVASEHEGYECALDPEAAKELLEYITTWYHTVTDINYNQ